MTPPDFFGAPAFAGNPCTPSGGGAGDQTPEGGLRTTAELAKGVGRRCAAPGALCHLAQAALLAAGGGSLGAAIGEAGAANAATGGGSGYGCKK